MEIRKSNQKLEMKKPPKTQFELLVEHIERLDKKLDKIIKVLNSKN